jgi:hypothetical protein
MRELIKPIAIILTALIIGAVPTAVLFKISIIEAFIVLFLTLIVIVVAIVVFVMIAYAWELIFDYLEDRFR